MPGITLHFVLAKRVLERWQSTAEAPPFDVHCRRDRNAFLHGALGPDFGYMPGGHRVLSELAHRVRTGELSTRLIHSARTSIERAFAWGWLTHVLADRQIHPLIGRGVGELVHGCRETFVAGSDDLVSHVRIETGVDCTYALRDGGARSVRLRPAFDDVSVNFLAHAYAATYGFRPAQRTLLRSHHCVGLRVRQALTSVRAVAALMDRSFVSPVLSRVLRTALGMRLISPVSAAYVTPVRPSAWLMRAIDEAIPAHTDMFMKIYRDGGADIGDFDLDTGERLVPIPSGGRRIGPRIEEAA
ncbi:MAG: zinc dependent phospholipase C family protein [Gemmatimonadales bacterium]